MGGGVPQTVPVGNPGNKADGTGFGSVAYDYRIGKYEVTNAEYCEFLNAVAKTDRHQLYDARMAAQYGGIIRQGSSGSHTYKTKPDGGAKPIGFVTWHSCVRYANWLSNGGGSGDTETGSYTFNGGRVTAPNHAELATATTTKWVVANENEWYKAAYYDANKPGYWPFALKGGSAPKCNLNTDQVRNVGSFEDAPSPYGTFDQNGNMWEYYEIKTANKVGLRGGSFHLNDNVNYIRSSTRYEVLSAKWPNYGFRVVALGSGNAAPANTDVTIPNTPKTVPIRLGPALAWPAPTGGFLRRHAHCLRASVLPGPSRWPRSLCSSSTSPMPGKQCLRRHEHKRQQASRPLEAAPPAPHNRRTPKSACLCSSRLRKRSRAFRWPAALWSSALLEERTMI